MDNSTLCWVYLQQALKYKKSIVHLILENDIDINSIYDENFQKVNIPKILFQGKIEPSITYSIEKAKEIIHSCEKLGYSIITPTHPDYPNRLLEIDDPPAVLYVQGDISGIDEEFAISIVGARNPTVYGLKSTFEFSEKLSKLGVVIVSGGALGIDSAAHRGVLKQGGKTIAVLGCGINTHYLMDNKEMRDSIARLGAVISEYPPDTPPYSYHFPTRNRIIAALSLGTLVVEAGAKSGSLITVKHALEQGKEVFAIPGQISSPTSKGTNKMIREGAKPVLSVVDIIEEFKDRLPIDIYLQENEKEYRTEYTEYTKENVYIIKDSNEKIKKNLQKKIDFVDENNKIGNNIVEGLSKDAQNILNNISNNPIHIDTLSYQTKMDIRQVLLAVTELEMQGIIKSVSGRMYVLA